MRISIHNQEVSLMHPESRPKRVTVFTSAALNYLPKVRVLFTSLRRHHPDWRLILLLTDEARDALDLSKEPMDEVISFEQLDIPHKQAWAFCHTLTELATAIKPFMLKRLLADSHEGDSVLYLDPDIAVFSPLNDILDQLEQAGLAVTPHQVMPEQSLDAVMDNEICSLKHGIYNLGFLAVRSCAEGKAFAQWWSERCYYFCRDDIGNGLFTDQRWIDLVPALFDSVVILRNSRFNVATWNVTTRHLSETSDHVFSVDGKPLGFYHFTGFDSGAHRLMASKNGGDNQALFKLINWYQDQLDLMNHGQPADQPWAYATYSNGEMISAEQRHLYRFRLDLQRSFSDPYDANGYLKWWHCEGEKAYLEYQRLRAEKKFYLTPGYLGSGQADRNSASPMDTLLPLSSHQHQHRPIDSLRKRWRLVRSKAIHTLIQLLR